MKPMPTKNSSQASTGNPEAVEARNVADLGKLFLTQSASTILSFHHIGAEDKPILPVVLMPPTPPPEAATMLVGRIVQASASDETIASCIRYLMEHDEFVRADDGLERRFGTFRIALTGAGHRWQGIRNLAHSRDILNGLQGQIAQQDSAAREALNTLLRRLPRSE